MHPARFEIRSESIFGIRILFLSTILGAVQQSRVSDAHHLVEVSTAVRARDPRLKLGIAADVAGLAVGGVGAGGGEDLSSKRLRSEIKRR